MLFTTRQYQPRQNIRDAWCMNGWQNFHSRICVGVIANRLPMGPIMWPIICLQAWVQLGQHIRKKNFLKTQNCEMSVKTKQKDFAKVMQMTFICITKTLWIDALVWCFQRPLKDSMSQIHCHTNMLYCNAPVFIGLNEWLCSPSHLQIAQYSMHNTHKKKYFRFDLWHS